MGGEAQSNDDRRRTSAVANRDGSGPRRPGGAVRPARRRGPHLRFRHRLRQRKIAGPAGLKWRSNANIRKAQKALATGSAPAARRAPKPDSRGAAISTRADASGSQNIPRHAGKPFDLDGATRFSCYGGNHGEFAVDCGRRWARKRSISMDCAKTRYLSEREENRETNREIIQP